MVDAEPVTEAWVEDPEPPAGQDAGHLPQVSWQKLPPVIHTSLHLPHDCCREHTPQRRELLHRFYFLLNVQARQQAKPVHTPVLPDPPFASSVLRHERVTV